MRNFLWKYFTLTGDVESFLLYKEVDQLRSADRLDSVPEASGGENTEEYVLE